MNREFRLSSPGKGGISCGADGAFIAAIPVLDRLQKDGKDEWRPRGCDELSEDLAEHYGLPIDMSSKTGGLKAIANALNDGDVARAQIATVLLGIPEPPQLSKRARSREHMIKLIRDLHWSGMIKADWDSDEHPRWPGGNHDGKGGKFSPKGQGGEVGASPTSQPSAADRTSSHSPKQVSPARDARVQLADNARSDAADDPTAEAAARAAAAARQDTGAVHSQATPADGERENFLEALGSSLSHEVKSALVQMGNAQIAESNANLAASTAAADEIARALKAYANYRAQLWLDSDGHPLEIYAATSQAELMIRLAAKLPLTRPATNADWIDPLVNLAATIPATGPAFRFMGPAGEVLSEIAGPAAESNILIGNSGFRSIGEFTDAAATKYQALYDEGYALATDRAKQELIANNPLVIGRETDSFARYGLKDWLMNAEGIEEGPGKIIQVNRRLYDLAGSGSYRVPDVYVPGSQTILDGSMQFKTSSMAQISDYGSFSGGAKVVVIRPAAAPHPVAAGSYSIVY